MINKRRFLFMFLFCSPYLFMDGAAKADLFSKEQTNFLPVRCLAKVEPLFVPGLDRMVDALDDFDRCRRLIMLSENFFIPDKSAFLNNGFQVASIILARKSDDMFCAVPRLINVQHPGQIDFDQIKHF